MRVIIVLILIITSNLFSNKIIKPASSNPVELFPDIIFLGYQNPIKKQDIDSRIKNAIDNIKQDTGKGRKFVKAYLEIFKDLVPKNMSKSNSELDYQFDVRKANQTIPVNKLENTYLNFNINLNRNILYLNKFEVFKPDAYEGTIFDFNRPIFENNPASTYLLRQREKIKSIQYANYETLYSFSFKNLSSSTIDSEEYF